MTQKTPRSPMLARPMGWPGMAIQKNLQPKQDLLSADSRCRTSLFQQNLLLTQQFCPCPALVGYWKLILAWVKHQELSCSEATPQDPVAPANCKKGCLGRAGTSPGQKACCCVQRACLSPPGPLGEATSQAEALSCPRAIGVSRSNFRDAHQLLFLCSL